ncbi:MAG: hypothetical protein JNJ73_00965 [Hyphomonadaceae bacterium]|nr:hypothetical protein [Hyphomonadaceae bacterium]
MKRMTIAALCAATMLGWAGAASAQDGGRWERGGGRGDGGRAERSEGRRGGPNGGDGGGQGWRQQQGNPGGNGGGPGWRQQQGNPGGDGAREARRQGGGPGAGGGEGWRQRQQAQPGNPGAGGEPAWRPPQQRPGGPDGQNWRGRYAGQERPQGQPRVQGAPDQNWRGRSAGQQFPQGEIRRAPDSQRERRAFEGGPGPRTDGPRIQGGGPSQEWRQRQQGQSGQAYRQRGPDQGEVLRGGPDYRRNPDQRQASPSERWRSQGGDQRGFDQQRRDGWRGDNRGNYSGRPDLNRGDNNRRYSGDRRGPSRAYTQLRPRAHSYRDWRAVPQGRYFDRGYASVIGRYYNHHYRWWGEPGWRTPYRPWRVGYYLPAYASYGPVPYDLYRLLPPPPYGCRYVRYGNDILLIAISSLMVLDAILWLDDGDYYGYDDGYYDDGGYYEDDRYGDDYYDEY